MSSNLKEVSVKPNFKHKSSNFRLPITLKQGSLLMAVALVVLLFAFGKNLFSGIRLPQSEGHSKAGADAETGSTLIFEETFEGTSYFPLKGNQLNRTHAIENCESDWTLSTVSSPIFQGNRSCRFEIRKDQPLVGSSQRVRSEVTIIKASEDERFTPEIWYSFAVLFPEKGMEYSKKRDCINQWFEDGSRETTLRVEKDKAFLELFPIENNKTRARYDLFSPLPGGEEQLENMVSIPKDEWHEFVFHFIHAMDSTGLIEVWRDNQKIHEIHGRNMHLQYPKWKIGLYNTKLDESENYARVIYFDNIRVGKSSSTLADMSSLPQKK